MGWELLRHLRKPKKSKFLYQLLGEFRSFKQLLFKNQCSDQCLFFDVVSFLQWSRAKGGEDSTIVGMTGTCSGNFPILEIDAFRNFDMKKMLKTVFLG